MPNARTATVAMDSSKTGGICEARAMSHAATAERATALPSPSTPSMTDSATRERSMSRSVSARRRGSRACQGAAAEAAGDGPAPHGVVGALAPVSVVMT